MQGLSAVFQGLSTARPRDQARTLRPACADHPQKFSARSAIASKFAGKRLRHDLLLPTAHFAD
jgi:hypothetical protein